MGRLLLPHSSLKVGGVPPWVLQQFVEPREQAALGTSVVALHYIIWQVCFTPWVPQQFVELYLEGHTLCTDIYWYTVNLKPQAAGCCPVTFVPKTCTLNSRLGPFSEGLQKAFNALQLLWVTDLFGPLQKEFRKANVSSLPSGLPWQSELIQRVSFAAWRDSNDETSTISSKQTNTYTSTFTCSVCLHYSARAPGLK